ncbi:MAG: PucR family transcriptional regulator ligand-binding domain-containing protein, partial [Firmicutes bacterium]|nr:PucR family transcriptional regulator ligand-binding domain-containing protein [Bacillota bacterium]
MSVTVSDLLNLPSLKQAKVVAGSGGLNKIVSTISVLETVDPSILIDGLFSQGEYFGSEIVITGFINCINDVDCQCANIKRLAEGGDVGIILFYVGIYRPKIDQRLIDL